jgi:hypothetical protein
MNGHPISVSGIEIPSDAPFFLTLIAIHILAALSCVISGVIAMVSKKGSHCHIKAGSAYYYGLLIVFITVIVISVLRWKEDYHLFLLGLLSFGMAFTGRLAVKQKWNKWPVYHVCCMGFSYIVLITAFYVDNGKFLPIWRDFSPIIYWTLPAIVGLPIIVATLIRHPIMKLPNTTIK